MYAAERARILFGSYRKGEANDPDTYAASIAAVLAEYPVETIQFVTDPRTGIARTIKFLPSVSEVIEACDDHYRPTKLLKEREALEAKQIKEREQAYLPTYRPNPNAKLVSYKGFIEGGGVRPIGRFEKQD